MNVWQYHDSKMKELSVSYKKLGRQRAVEINNLISSVNVNKDNLYKLAQKTDIKKLKVKIQELKDDGLLVGISGMFLLSLLHKNRINNNEILKALTYIAYIEEDNKASKIEDKVFYDDMNYYYREAQKEKGKDISNLGMSLFLVLMSAPNYSGLNWNDYKQTIMDYNVNKIYKQILTNIQQEKPLDFNSSEFQKILDSQERARLNIKENKVSGYTDLNLIGLNNQVKVKAYGDDSQVIFLAVEDDVTTEMCHSLDMQVFNVKGPNEFYRMYGENQKELSMQKIKCNGLVLGLNLPPIEHHFHYCRSTITYNSDENNKYLALYNTYKPISKDINVKIDDYNDFVYNIKNNKGYLEDLQNRRKSYIIYNKQLIIEKSKTPEFESFYKVYNKMHNLSNITTFDDIKVGKIMPHTMYRMAQRNISYEDFINALKYGNVEYDKNNNSLIYRYEKYKYSIVVAIANDDNHNVKTVMKRRNKYGSKS